MEELQQRFQELEAQLGRHADKAKYLRDQGLHELADREDQRWKEVSKEYATVGSQIENLRPKAKADSCNPSCGYTPEEWERYCGNYKC